MTAPVEAGSLSALTALASNPPKYPRNPAHEARESLVLYITRVPGSKDIFLTTIKPRQKTVTAEDVTSSLYYIHVNQPEDEQLLQEVEQQLRNKDLPETPGTASEDERNHVLRKPLPPNPRLSQQGSPVVPSKTYPDYQLPRGPPNVLPKVDRKPVQQVSDVSTVTETAWAGVQKRSVPPSQYQAPQRRLLGPRPVGSSRLSSSEPLSGVENIPRSHKIERKPVLPTRSVEDRYLNDPSRLKRRSESALKRSAEPLIEYGHVESNGIFDQTNSRDSQSVDGPGYFTQSEPDIVPAGDVSLVLIRRDPSSGGQWNVGNITITIDSDGSRTTSEPNKRPMFYAKPKPSLQRIEVEITNPGYRRFLPPKRPPIYPSPPSEGKISLSEGRVDAQWKDFAYMNALNPPAVQDDTRSRDEGDRYFKREVWVEGSNFWDRAVRKKRTDSMDVSPAVAPLAGAAFIDPFEGVRPSTGVEKNRGDSEFGTSLSTAKPVASKGISYVFLSPWDGRCEFSTGGGGRSLKCRHTPASTPGSRPHQPAPVSELRFNLPASAVLSSATNNLGAQTPVSSASSLSAGGSSNGSKRSSIFSASGLKKHLRPPTHRATKSMLTVPTVSINNKDEDTLFRSDDDYADNISDLERGFHSLLALGREKAGGGAGGKKAKLGKLIVSDEGLKMLDLVVAANVGVWWRAWGKV